MDYVSNLFGVIDGYLNCSVEQLVNLSYNNKSYLQMLFDFVNECLFDPELESIEKGYACGILMIMIHYCYPTMDSILEPCVQIVQKYLIELEKTINELMNEPDESIREYYLELNRDCVVSTCDDFVFVCF